VALSQPPVSTDGQSFHYDLSRCRSSACGAGCGTGKRDRASTSRPLAYANGWLKALILTFDGTLDNRLPLISSI
ncbi:MAG: hypothetical protein L0312_21775, partial [Acidobacteria bacterium]|nr:hypothetical protein [Acidobacteriota bacterium]